ncbi:hypothetical protein D3C76_1348110 [compost metagenome]
MLHPRTASDNDGSAVFGKPLQCRGNLCAHKVKIRGNNKLISIKRLRPFDHITADPELGQSTVVILNIFIIVHTIGLRLNTERLQMFMGQQNSHVMIRGGTLQLSRKSIDFTAKLSKFGKAAAGYIAVINQPMPELFRSHRGRTPAEMDHCIGPLRDGLPSKCADKSGIGGAPYWKPTARWAA